MFRRIVVHALQQPQHVPHARPLSIQVAELPDVTAVEVLDHADDLRRLCRQHLEGRCSQVEIVGVEPELFQPERDGVPAVVQPSTHVPAALSALTRPAADNEISTVGPADIIEPASVEPVLEPLVVLGCERQRRRASTSDFILLRRRTVLLPAQFTRDNAIHGWSPMELIDDDGDLFGVVNVVDALVVLVVLAVGVAGVALVFTDDPAPQPDTDTTYATLDMGTQPAYIVDAINEGDTFAPDDTSSITITDVHLTPRGNDIGVTLRVELQGETDGDVLTYANAPPRLGRTLAIETSQYEVSGQIRDTGDDDALAGDIQQIIVRDTLDAETATTVTPGDEIRLAGRTVATIEDVVTYATNNSDRTRVLVETNVSAHHANGQARFGGVPLQRGQPITLPADKYTIDGQIERVNDDPQLGGTSTREVTLRMTEVREDTAETIEPGMTEGPTTDPVAEVTNVETEPSLIIATGEDGSVNVVDHPINRDVTVTADIQVRDTPTGVQFKGEPLRGGTTITLDLGTRVIEAEVVSVA